jgi:hypothetical protein
LSVVSIVGRLKFSSAENPTAVEASYASQQ